MKTYNQTATDFTTISNDASAANLALGKSLMNQCIHKILAMDDWTFNRNTYTFATVASQQDYNPPYDMWRMDYLNLTYGGVKYVPIEIKSGRKWALLNEVLVYGNVPQYWFISNKTQKIGIWPIPSDALGSVKIGYIKKVRDLSVADYTTGTIAGTIDTTALTGGGATFTSAMIGRYIQIDGFWYLITAVPTAATLTTREKLKDTYTTSTFTISELIPFPDGFEDIPLWYALEKYYQMREKPVIANQYGLMWRESQQEMLRRDSRSVVGILEKEPSIRAFDPNIFPQNLQNP